MFTPTQQRQALIAIAIATTSLIIASCGDSDGPASASPSSTTTTSVAPMPDATATYNVTFDATWSAGTHPNMFPPNPHFSPLIGTTHAEGYRFWQSGAVASNGMESMAERGATTPLDDEIMTAIGNGRAQNLLRGEGIANSPGSVALSFDITLEFPQVSLVSMVAPSPDWFVGISAVSLMESGDWVEELEIELFAYDAGTDSGTTYNSADSDTQPRIPIARIEDAPVAPGGMSTPLGRFTFRRQ